LEKEDEFDVVDVCSCLNDFVDNRQEEDSLITKRRRIGAASAFFGGDNANEDVDVDVVGVSGQVFSSDSEDDLLVIPIRITPDFPSTPAPLSVPTSIAPAVSSGPG